MKKIALVLGLSVAAVASQAVQVVYAGVPGPYSAFAAGPGIFALDDYTSTFAGSEFRLHNMRFVGGVTVAGMQVDLEFYRADSTLRNVARVTLPSGGDFIWTITFADTNGESNFWVPSNGFLQIRGVGAATGRWFFTTTPPTVGANSVTVGTGSTLNPQRNNAFELTAVPEPGSMLALGMGAATLLVRRRRRK